MRETHELPSQMVVRAIGKVVEGYKAGSKTKLTFGETTSVVYDTRQIAFKWMNFISISTIGGRIEIPFQVAGYRLGTYDRRVTGQADLILQDGKYYLLLQVDLPEISNITTIDFKGIST
ncbi:hypothetical protein [Paenibacillus ihuae]|uniref:hypothetical protein n=1 Tax=Paenibacillus ihuae TaxID=1232431 RepID=UPI001FD763C6|nr:hypothetical protein [Paenibacillus ihuae]